MLRSITRCDSNHSGSGSAANMTTSSRKTASMDGSYPSDRQTFGSNHGLQANNVTSIPFGVLTSTSQSTSASSKMTKITLSPSSSVNQNSYQIPHAMERQRLPQISSRSHSLTPPTSVTPENHYEYVVSQRCQQSPSSQEQSPQNQATVKHRLHPMVSVHRMIPVNSAVAFPAVSLSSSSSCASSGSNSNPPSVPTTPESQSSERLSSITRSQPDLSKLEDLQVYLAKNDTNLDNSNHNDIIGHLQYNNTAGQGFIHQLLYHNQTSMNSSVSYPQEAIYSNAQLSHSNSGSVNSNTSGVSGSNNTNNSLNHLNYDSSMFHERRESDVSEGHSLPPPSPPKNQCPRYSNVYSQRSHHYDHEYQNQQNLNELLILENRELKSQVEELKKKIARFERLENEVCRVHSAHEELMRSAEKKEKLERAVRYKLEIEVRRLQTENRELREENSQTLAVAIAAATNMTSNHTANWPDNIDKCFPFLTRPYTCTVPFNDRSNSI